MKFNLKEAEPSQELIGVISLVLWAPFLILFGAVAIDALKSFIKKMISGGNGDVKLTVSQKLISAVYMINFECLDYNDEPIIERNDYPRADLTDAKDGRHWEIDPDAVKSITAASRDYGEDYDCADKFRIFHVADIVTTVKKIDALITFMSGISNLTGCAKSIDSYLKSHFTKDELTVDNDNDWQVYTFKNKPPVKVQWPNAEQFKQPITAVNKIKAVGKSLVSHCQTLSKKYDSVVPNEEEVDKMTDKAAAQDIAVYIKTCDEIVMYLGAISVMLDYCFPTLNNDEIYGSGLRLVDKSGKDITYRH